jgi:energy-coupling factor transporter ATP-binding protein EcfA2
MPARRPDFIVEWQGTPEATTAKIFYNLFVKKIEADMPLVCAIVGKSGRGKSNVAIHLADILFKQKGLDYKEYILDSVINSVEDFGPKTKAILHDKKLKKCFILIIDEAKATINSKDWASLVNRAIGMINSLSRAIKPLAIFVVAQSLQDIDSSVRKSLDYYIKVSRTPKCPAKAKVYEFYFDDRDIDKPKTKKKIVRGIVQQGHMKDNIELTSITFPRVRQEIWDLYKKGMIESKNKLLEDEFDKLAQALLEKNDTKHKQRIEELVNFVRVNPEIRNKFVQYKRNKYLLVKEFTQHFMVTESEKRLIEKMLTQKAIDDQDEEDLRKVKENGFSVKK